MPVQVTDVFYASFIQWLHESGLKYSTIRSYCDQLRCLLFWTAKHGCKLSPTFDSYSIPQYFVSKLALTQDEISHIAHHDVYRLPGRPQTIKTLERVRDTFVLCCNLGQRYSDIIRICPDNFNRNIYKTIQKKTGSKAIVDIDKYADNDALAAENLLFLPAAGNYPYNNGESSCGFFNTRCYYWSSSTFNDGLAYFTQCDDKYLFTDMHYESTYKFSIRLVTDVR